MAIVLGMPTTPTLTPVPGATPRYDDDEREIVRVMTCGTCGRSWNDAAVSSVTPVPAGRCPFEYEHGKLTETEQFFFDNAGYCVPPGQEECARRLAAAEQRLHAGPYWTEIEPDDMPWDGDVPYDGPLWIVSLYTTADDGPNPKLLGSLGGVACDEDDDYLRVVAAELAQEHIPS